MTSPPRAPAKASEDYDLTTQVGFNLRRANQRHVGIFARHVADLTPTQFAVLAQLQNHGGVSQNHLGRMTAMDSATIQGVVSRLVTKGLVVQRPDPKDLRLRRVELTEAGRAAFDKAHAQALAARTETLAPLTDAEVAQFEALLSKLV